MGLVALQTTDLGQELQSPVPNVSLMQAFDKQVDLWCSVQCWVLFCHQRMTHTLLETQEREPLRWDVGKSSKQTMTARWACNEFTAAYQAEHANAQRDSWVPAVDDLDTG